MNTSRCLLIGALVALAAASPARAQGGDRYVPIAAWYTPYLEHFIRAGILRGLDPLTRPLRRADVARAIAAVDTSTLSTPQKRTLQLLASEVADRTDSASWQVEANVAVLGASDASRWAVRPQTEDTRAYYQGGLTGSLAFPHVVLVTSPYFDTRLKYDTAFNGIQRRIVGGDNAESYALASWRYFDLFFGIEPRNWGPPEVQGSLISTSPYPYDHFMLRIGPRRLRLEFLATQLDNLPDAAGTPNKRFMSAHRLIVTPSDRLSVSLSEGVLYADAGAPARSFEPWFLNPTNLWLLPDVNGYGGLVKDYVAADGSYGFGNGVRLAGEVFLNDFKVDARSDSNPEKRPQVVYTASATGPALRARASWSLFYTKVYNLVYQTQKGTQFDYVLRGVGIGRDHIDYDQLTARLTAITAPRTLLGVELTYIRQGEGNFLRPFPPAQVFQSDSVQFLTGVVERTLRVAAQATWSPLPGMNFSADIGRHFVSNANHVLGVNGDRWVWRLRAEMRRSIGGIIR